MSSPITSTLVVDVHERADEESIVGLIAMGLDAQNPSGQMNRAARAAGEYKRGQDDLRLWGLITDETVLGIIGVQPTEGGRVLIRDLAVAPDARMRGIGRALIDFARRALKPREMAGHTHSGAVGFYEKCGFEVRVEGCLPAGEPRYRFAWRTTT